MYVIQLSLAVLIPRSYTCLLCLAQREQHQTAKPCKSEGFLAGQLIYRWQGGGWKPLVLELFTGHRVCSVLAEATQTFQGQTLPVWLNCHLSEAQGTKPTVRFGVWIT